MRPCKFLLFAVFFPLLLQAQSRIDSLRVHQDVKITLDKPARFRSSDKTIIIIYALPNGNTTVQTMGRQIQPGDDWHFDIQHIRAQTAFIRQRLKQNIVVAYLENDDKSWPLWKQKHPDYTIQIPALVDTIWKMVKARHKIIYLNGHSGGGSFIFGYIEGIKQIPSNIKRISFLDSNYGYDSTYAEKFIRWLHRDKKNTLTVFAYNDSLALYNGKPLVSARGGTWYHSHMMMNDLSSFQLVQIRKDSLEFYQDRRRQVAFFLLQNPERKIYHTQQVELNGFIHSILYRTPQENKGYRYLGPRAYIQEIGRE